MPGPTGAGTGPGWDSPLPPGGASVNPPTAANPKATTATGDSVADLRAQRDKLQAQLDDLQGRVQRGEGTTGEKGQYSQTEVTQLNSLNTRISQLTNDMQVAQNRSNQTISGTNPDDHYIIQTRPDGTIVTDPATGKPPENPNWNHKNPGSQNVTVGNQIVNIAPDGTVTAAYTNQDAQNLADRQTAVAEGQLKVSQLAQQTNDFTAHAQADLAQRVSNGEDAASVRAEQAQKLQELHTQWTEADGDAQRAQTALRDYNTERHNTAAEQLNRDTLQQTADWQSKQDATTRRGQDLQSAQAQAATRATMANARLSSGASYAGNVMNTLAAMNKDVNPGSSAVGDMLVPLLNLGQSFFSQLGGLPSADSVVGSGAAPADQATSPAAAVTPTTAPVVTADPTPPPPDTTPTAPVTPGGTADDWYTQWQQRQAADAAQQAAASAAAAGSSVDNFVSKYLPGMATGGVVNSPTPIVAGDQGPEAIVPLGPGPSDPSSISRNGNLGSILSTLGAFLASLGSIGSSGGATPSPASPLAPSPADPSAALAANAAAATGNPPAAGANPMLPGSAVPGVPPAAAGAQARMRPLAPDGSPYATPQDVTARWAARRGAAAGAASAPPPSGGPQAQPATAGVGG